MRRPALLTSCLALVMLVASGCASAYSSLYKETNHQLHPAPVAAKDVKVVKAREDLSRSFLKSDDGRIFAEDIVSDFSRRHRGPHFLGRLSNCIAAEIDHRKGF